jgi:hypothetical protein
MPWIEMALTVVAGVVVLMVVMAVILARRPADVHKLGSVSNRWIAEHRVDSPSVSLH